MQHTYFYGVSRRACAAGPVGRGATRGRAHGEVNRTRTSRRVASRYVQKEISQDVRHALWYGCTSRCTVMVETGHGRGLLAFNALALEHLLRSVAKAHTITNLASLCELPQQPHEILEQQSARVVYHQEQRRRSYTQPNAALIHFASINVHHVIHFAH
jgi:hypothetical protein